MTNLKSGKRKRPMQVLDASSMLSIKGGKRKGDGQGQGGTGTVSGGGEPPQTDW